jgi:hypothetical protein
MGQLWMREVRGVEADRDLQVFLGQIQIAEVEVREPQLGVSERIVRSARNAALVVSDRLLRSPEVQQHAAQIDKRLEGFGIDIEGSAEVRFRFPVPPRLIRNRTRRHRTRLRAGEETKFGLIHRDTFVPQSYAWVTKGTANVRGRMRGTLTEQASHGTVSPRSGGSAGEASVAVRRNAYASWRR